MGRWAGRNFTKLGVGKPARILRKDWGGSGGNWPFLGKEVPLSQEEETCGSRPHNRRHLD